MTLDRLQSKPGQFVVSPENAQTTTGTATSVVSNQVPGGIAFGSIAGFCSGTASSAGGGAPFNDYQPKATTTGSFGQSMATGGTVSHFGAGIIGLNATTTANNLQMQPALVPGQRLTLVNCGTASCSFVTTGTVNNWSTTGTVTAQVLEAAFTINSGSARVLQANPFAVTTTGQYPAGLWKVIV